MNLFGKKEKESEDSNDEFNQVIADNDIKTGQIKIYRIKKVPAGRQTRRTEYFVSTRSLRDLGGDSIEDFLALEYGGGEYLIKLYKITNNKIHTLIQSFPFLIAGPEIEETEAEPKDSDSFRRIAEKALENQLSGGGPQYPQSQYPPAQSSSDNTLSKVVEIVLTNMLEKNKEGLADRIDELIKLKHLLGSEVPTIPPESETSKLIDAGAQIVSAMFASKAGASSPMSAMTGASRPNLAEMPLPIQNTIPNTPIMKQPIMEIPGDPPENINGNGHKPIPMSINQAFEVIYLDRFKEAAQADATEQELGAMIESMAVNAMFWLDGDEYHPVIKNFADGYADMDLQKLAKGYDELVNFAGITPDKAARIKALLLSIYQDRYATKEKDIDAKNQAETETNE